MGKKLTLLLFLILYSLLLLGCNKIDNKSVPLKINSQPTLTMAPPLPEPTMEPTPTITLTPTPYEGPMAGLMSKED